MTLQELYQMIGGDYEQALKVLRMDKLLDKHVRKLVKNDLVEKLLAAGESMDPVQLFETSHAIKGVCANLGLTILSGMASEISEEFRPGTDRSMSDEQVQEKLQEIKELYDKTAEGIRKYEEA